MILGNENDRDLGNSTEKTVEHGRFSERLRLAIGLKSVRSFAKMVGISPTVLHQYLSGKSEPTRPILIMLADGAKVRLEWLITGHGSMKEQDSVETTLEKFENASFSETLSNSSKTTTDNLKSGLSEDFSKKFLNLAIKLGLDESQFGLFFDELLQIKSFEELPSDFSYLPVVKQESFLISKKSDLFGNIDEFVPIKNSWLKRLGIEKTKDVFLFYANNDGMAPTIKQGEYAFVERTSMEIWFDGLAILKMGDLVSIRRIQELPGNLIQISCDNSRYSSFKIGKTDFQNDFSRLGKVFASIKIEDL